MSFEHALAAAAAFVNPETFDTFRTHLDPAWIEGALAATGTATIRKRRLPAEQVVWVVLGMALFRDRSIADVVSKLDLALPERPGTSASKGSIAEARKRLGSEPMKWLFETSAAKWSTEAATEARWRGLAVYGSTAARYASRTRRRIARRSAVSRGAKAPRAAIRSCGSSR